MKRSVVYVHGTGVREIRFAEMFKIVDRELRAIDEQMEVLPCFWGASEGTQLPKEPASIPQYAEAGGEGPSERDEELALWAVLYIDPWYELRLIAELEPSAVALPPGHVDPGTQLIKQLSEFEPSDELSALLDEHRLAEHWPEAHGSLIKSAEFSAAAVTASADPIEHRRVLAKAVLAKALVAAEAAGQPPISGDDRDMLVEFLLNELGGFGYGLKSFLTGAFKGMAARAITRVVESRRGAVSDAVAPLSGDIILYQARGEGIREYMAKTIELAQGESVTVLAHSLGGIAAVDALVLKQLPDKVDSLITVGSQAPLLYEINALVSLPYGDAVPDTFPRWLNLYDSRDFLSYTAGGVFPGPHPSVTDTLVDSGQPFPQAHSAYWTNKAVWEAIDAFLE